MKKINEWIHLKIKMLTTGGESKKIRNTVNQRPIAIKEIVTHIGIESQDQRTLNGLIVPVRSCRYKHDVKGSLYSTYSQREPVVPNTKEQGRHKCIDLSEHQTLLNMQT